MRVIFILDNLYPNGKASASRVRSYGKGFISNGIDVLVLLPVPRQRYFETLINPFSQGVDQNGVAYKYMAGTSRRSKYVLIRKIQDIVGYSLTLASIFFRSRPDDYIIIYEGSPLWYYLCILVAHWRHLKVGLELNELPYVTGAETNKTKRKRRFVLSQIFPRVDFVLAISEPLVELSREHAKKALVVKVPIIVEGELQGDDFETPRTPYIFHSGTLYEQKDGICGMIEAFGMACQQINLPLEYILTGELKQSPHAEEIEEIVHRYHIEDKVKFVGYLDIPTLRRYQKNCCLTIINKYDTRQNKYCFSTKLSEYLSFARPVITTSIGEANNYLKDNVNALIVAPHRPDLIAEKIVYLIRHPQEAKRIGDAGHQLVEKEFNCVYQTGRIIDLLKTV